MRQLPSLHRAAARSGKFTLGLAVLAAVAAGGCGPADKQAELDGLLKRIDQRLVAQTEQDMRAYLDARMKLRIGPVLPGEDRFVVRHENSVGYNDYWGRATWQGYAYFDAYDILGDEKYLQVALDMADFVVKTQQPKGYWLTLYTVGPSGEVSPAADTRVCRLQDTYQYGRFCYMLYAYNVTGDKKYLDAAIRNADYLLSIQNDNGSWPDYWIDGTIRGESTGVSGNGGVGIGGSYNDGATTLPMMTMIAAYHLTKDRKYLARVGKIGQWIFDTQMGEGKVRGWCQQYDLDNKAIKARNFEMPVIELRTFNRFVVPICTWMYAMTGQERYMTLLAETVEWMESVRQPKGWAYQYLPDGTPVFSMLFKTFRYDSPQTWPKPANEWQARHLNASSKFGSSKSGTSGAKSVLKLWREGGRDAVAKSLTGPVELSPEAYLDARIAAARRALDEANLKVVRQRPIASADPKWALGRGENQRGNAAVQWKFLTDVRIAAGRFTPRQLAGGAPPHCGGRGTHAYKVANWLALPRLPD